MNMHAMNTMSTAERISQRVPAEHEQQTTPRARDAYGAFGVRSDVAGRFDVVPGGRSAASPAAPARPAVSLRSSVRQASWSPAPVYRQSAAVEQYRRLAAQLIQASVEHGVSVVMIASSVRGEGKSLTAANLAVTLARSYQRDTLLIDADQRAPKQHEIFHVDNVRGLSDWLRNGPDTAAGTVQLMPSLTLLTAGRPTMDPMAGLTSQHMKALIAEAKSAFDFVVLDTPAATLVPDAGVLVSLVDTAVLVIRAGSTAYAAVDRAVATLGRDRILGTVLNRADKSTSAGRYWYGHGRT
ncbi:MAG: CpsD/CapB family tyrosine-protein kinase [Acidobacteria bacterium]|nr:CpsD/CapB family tyrosine-protein kinase [Acidobacteriota bacterium]